MSHAQAYLVWVALVAFSPRVLRATVLLVCRPKAALKQFDAASIAQSSCPLSLCVLACIIMHVCCPAYQSINLHFLSLGLIRGVNRQ